jgi:TetR/AcrR family transcriptional repressor of lmrAB and yxaGH operons
MAKPVSERAELLPLLGEVFRARGYEGATLALITRATGLGKGSLYHFFPGGKQQMAAEVLDEIDRWFEVNIFAPLRQTDDPDRAVVAMIKATDDYFRSGHRVCLVGVIALGASRDTFASQVHDDALLTIQGALVLARARGDAKIFSRAMAELQARLLAPTR